MVALSLGFIWPFYEYLRTGHTYYHPGWILDKDFSEYLTWYFQHKIYKQKYWNMDAYLARYFEAHNDAIKTFFELRDVPERQLIEYAQELGLRPKVLGDGSLLKNGTEATGNNGVSVDSENKNGNGTIGGSSKKVEDVLEEMVEEMLDDNPGMRYDTSVFA